MKTIIGLLMILCGIALGLYVGFWVMLAGGIIQIIEAVKLDDIPGTQIAIGIIRIIAAGFVGFFSGVVLVLPGAVLVGWKK